MAEKSLSGENYHALRHLFAASDQGELSNDDIGQLTSLIPEVRKMVVFTEHLYERMVLETAEINAGVPRGAATIIVDSEGRIVRTNKCAEALLNSGRLLFVNKDHLFAISNKDNDSLCRIMDKALQDTGAAVQDCALIGEDCEAGVHQLLVLPVPVEVPPFPWMQARKLAAVVVIDPMRKVKVISQMLKTLYHITPAEIELINAMANGIKPVQYAAQVYKSVPTVQSQRQAVFNKVGVRNQLELMRVLRDLTTSFEEVQENV